MSEPRQTTTAVSDAGAAFDFGRAAELLTDAAARAGAAIMRHFHEGPEVTFKDKESPVTRADHESEAILLAALARLAGNITVISEESCTEIASRLPTRFFLVDPLDGTKEFIQKRSDFTVNVALVEQGRPVFGLVYAPARSLLALTIAEGRAVAADLPPDEAGASLEGLEQVPLRTRLAPREGLTALISRSHLDPETESFIAKLRIAKRSSAGSSVKFIAIACGEADVYPRFGPTMEWDTAAGQAILEAAGGVVLQTDGRPLRYGKTDYGLRNPSFVAWGDGRAAQASLPSAIV
ncbi:MAG TPA: 3'(2'),5'-bisphosphate nucleotidase CysQ [Methyloceanibacter sp.]|nr:3'(2'),5'-bisphosphate nucleotidase CysQ [Methyloceanibacter sp.]